MHSLNLTRDVHGLQRCAWLWAIVSVSVSVCAGCSEASSGPQAPHANTRAPHANTRADAAPAAKTVAARQPEIVVPDLGTRHQGIDWPCFLGPNHDSRSPERGILGQWPESGPPVVWSMPLENSYGPASVSRGRLFIFDRHGDRAVLVCVQSETGKPLWEAGYRSEYEDFYNYQTGPRCSPVVDGGRVYVYGVEGILHCYRVTDGQLLWQLDTMSRFGVVQNFFGVGSTPVVEGDLLIVQVGGSPPGSPTVHSGRVRGNGSGVVALDKFTGEVRYKISDELASYSSPVPATIQGRRWCFVFARGGLLAFDPQNGKIDFHFPWRARVLESVNASNPVVTEDLVFISETYGPGSALLRVRPGGYETLWTDKSRGRRKSMQAHWNTPVLHDGYLYGSSGRHEANAELRCIELATGKVMWSEKGLGRCSLLYVDGHLVCLSEYGELLLLRATPRKFDAISRVVPRRKNSDRAAPGLRPARLLRPPAWAAPVLSHGLLYVRGGDRLVCLELIPDTKP